MSRSKLIANRSSLFLFIASWVLPSAIAQSGPAGTFDRCGSRLIRRHDVRCCGTRQERRHQLAAYRKH